MLTPVLPNRRYVFFSAQLVAAASFSSPRCLFE